MTHYPLSELANKALRIEGEELTLNGLGAILNAPVEKVDEVPVPEGGLPAYILTALQTVIEQGLLDINKKLEEGDGAGGANHLWEGHHWTTLEEFLKL